MNPKYFVVFFLNTVLCHILFARDELLRKLDELNLHSDFYNVLFSSKTPYYMLDFEKHEFLKPKGYEPISLIGFIRHGSRYPSRSALEEISSVTDKLKHLNVNLLQNRNSNIYVGPDGNSDLTQMGMVEMYKLGRRMVEEFPEFFSEGQYTEFNFQSTCVERSEKSLKYFKTGISSRNNFTEPTLSQKCEKEKKLRFFDRCDEYIKLKAELKSNYKNVLNEPIFTEVKHNIEKKLGIPTNSLTLNELLKLYTLCSFNSAIFYSNNDFKEDLVCKIFDVKSFALLELVNDIRMFEKSGSANRINLLMATELFKEIIEFTNHSMSNADQLENKRFFIRLAHAETLLPLMDLFRLKKEVVIGKNYKNKINLEKSFSKPRSFRSGLFVPMGANLFIVVFENKSNPIEKLAGVYINEKLTPLLCSKGTFSGFYFITLQDLNECFQYLSSLPKFSEICHNKNLDGL